MPCLAQTATTGAILGRVKDADGAAVPNVTVTITSENLIGVRSAISGRGGVFSIRNIPPGMYSVGASLEGRFIAPEGNSVEVNISKTSSLFILVPWHRENMPTAARSQQSHTP